MGTQQEERRRVELRDAVSGNALEIEKLKASVETRLSQMSQVSKQEGEVMQNALLSLEQSLKKVEERFLSAEEEMHSNAVSYQSDLDTRLGRMSEEKQRQGAELTSMSKSILEADSRFADTEKRLLSTASSYHELLDVRLAQLSEDVVRLRGEGEAAGLRLDQQESSLQNVAVRYQELLEGAVRDLKEETRYTTKLLNELEPLARSFDTKLDTLDSQTSQKLELFREEFTSETMQRIEILKTELKLSVEKLHKEVQSTTRLISENSGLQSEAFEKFCDETNQNLVQLRSYIETLEEQNGSLASEVEKSFNAHKERIQKNEAELIHYNQELTALGVLTNENMTNIFTDIELLKSNGKSSESGVQQLSETMNKLMEQTNTFLLKSGNQDSKMIAFESRSNDLETKIGNLESADTFLQESYTQLTERTMKLEKSSKEVEERLTMLKKTHEENIQPHLAKLDGEISEVKLENSNNNDMFENLTNKATDSLMSQMNTLKIETKENTDIIRKGIEDKFINM